METCMLESEQWFAHVYSDSYKVLYWCTQIELRKRGLGGLAAEDIVQETFILLYRKRASIISHPNPVGWLIRCMWYSLNNIEKKRGLSSWSLDAMMERGEVRKLAKVTDRILRDADWSARGRQVVDDIIELLDDNDDVELLLRRHVDGISVGQLAKEYNTTANAMAVRLHRLRQYVMQHMENPYISECM